MFTLTDIIAITRSKSACRGKETAVSGVSTDSRTIRKNEIFVALKGKRFNGAQFINEASEKGAVAAIVEKDEKVCSDIPLIRVENAVTALGRLAKSHRRKFDIPVIAVVGSNGKTTTKEMLSHVLGRRFNVLKTEGNNNNKVGVASTLLKLRDEAIAVIEVGTNLKGEIAYNAGILSPTIAVTTNIASSHLEGLGDKTGVLKEKIAIVESLGKTGTWIRNCDDEMLTGADRCNARVLDFGIRNKRADFTADKISLSNKGSEFYVNNVRIELPLPGIHNVYNSLAVIAAVSPFMGIEEVKGYLEDFQGTSMRTEIVDCGTFTVINDAYNSNPKSFKSAAAMLKNYKCGGRKIICCADMLELGYASQELHYDCGRFVADTEAADILVVFGKHAGLIGEGAVDKGMNKDKVKKFKDKNEMAAFLRRILSRGDIILVKGSRAMKMEEIVEALYDAP